MDRSVPPFTEEQKQQYRRYFAALRDHNQREQEWHRDRPIDPAQARRVGDELWQLLRERCPVIEGDTASDDEAEARVARAIFSIGTDRSRGEGS